MRRAIPWGLVGLVGLAGVVGAGLGLGSGRTTLTADHQLSQWMAATRRAGTARFTYSSVAHGADVLLSTTTGEGEVDFATDSVSTTESDHSTGLSGPGAGPLQPDIRTVVIRRVWIGRTNYIQPPLPARAVGSGWFEGATSPAGTFGPLGALSTVSPFDTLSAEASAAALRIEQTGGAVVDGVGTTTYLVALPTCRAPEHGAETEESISPTEVWVDGHGRIVRAADSTRFDVPAGTFDHDSLAGRALVGRSTISSMVRLFDFGRPVTIATPQLRSPGSTGSSGFAIAQSDADCSP
jgi:hypothetical protein